MATNDSNDVQSRGWLITAPADKYTQEDLLSRLEKYAGGVFQLERGEKSTDENPEGYLHWQIYLEHSTPILFSTLHNLLPGAHVEKRRGKKREAWDYCTKEDTRVQEPVEWGEVDLGERQGHRSDLEELSDAIWVDNLTYGQILARCPSALRYTSGIRATIAERDANRYSKQERFVESYYLWGAAGVGKTSLLTFHYGYENIYRVSDYKHPFDSYQGQDVLILDEFNDRAIGLSLLLNILDVYPLELPCRYQNKWAAFTKVWIVSNIPWYNHYEYELRDPRLAAAFKRRLKGIYKMISPWEVKSTQSSVSFPFKLSHKPEFIRGGLKDSAKSFASESDELDEPVDEKKKLVESLMRMDKE